MDKGCTMQDELPFEMTKDQKRIEELEKDVSSLEEKCHLYEMTLIEMSVKFKDLWVASQSYLELCKKLRDHGH